MSLYRALRLPVAAGRADKVARFNLNRVIRWQQTGSTGGRGGGSIKLLFYSATGLGVAAAGAIAYSSYDSMFKDKVNEYVPGFSRIADSAAGVFGSGAPPTTPKKDRKELAFKLESKDKVVTGTFTSTKTTKPDSIKESAATSDSASSDEPASKASSEPDIVVKSTEIPPGPEKETTPLGSIEPVPPPKIERTPPDTPQPPLSDEPVSLPDSVVEPKTIREQPLEEPVSTESDPPAVQGETPKQPLFLVENAVASAREESEKVAEKIMSEQVKDHQSTQTLGEQWMQDTAKVDARLQEALEEFKSHTNKILTAQRAVKEAVTQYQHKMAEVIQHTGDSTSSMETLAEDVADSEELVRERKQELIEVTLKHQEKTDALRSLLTTAEEVGLKSKAEEVVSDITRLLADLDLSEASIREIESSSDALRDYQEEARKSREQLQRELGTIPPEADLKQEAIVLMQSKRIEVLKERLESAEQENAQSLANALEKQKEKLEQLAEEKLRLSLQRQKLQLEQQFVRREYDIAHEFDSELREKLRLQSEAHTSYLTDALRSQASELDAKWSQALELKLMEQEGCYQAELNKAMARLRGIESMVSTVANAGEITRHQQNIRNACDTLSGALDQANTNPYDRFNFSKELSSLRRAARGDKFVLSVIESIPREAVSESAMGIQSESGLSERFQRVYKICKRVALVPETGGGLGTYALSYLQSLLVFNIRGVKETPDPSHLDTFDLLTLADSAMQRGDLEKAVWYVSHLKNESGRVAQDWLHDARLYLETRQAVRLIQTYTAATNVAFC